MIKEFLQTVLVISIIVSSLACAAKRPIITPNAHLESVGLDSAQRDIDDCLEGARERPGQAGQVAGSTAMGAATGAAVGAASGAVFGNAGRGAATGAAGGAAAGLIQVLLHSQSRDLDPEQRRRVEECLRDKGYEISGWE